MFWNKKNKESLSKKYIPAQSQSMSSEILSNEYSTNYVNYGIKRTKNFVPIIILGWFPIKTQYFIAGAMSLVGLIGSYSFYNLYKNENINLNLFQETLNKNLLNYKEKDFLFSNLQNLNLSLDKKEVLKMQQNLKNSDFILNSISEIESIIKKMGLENSNETQDLLLNLSKIGQYHTSKISNLIDFQNNISIQLDGLKNDLNNILAFYPESFYKNKKDIKILKLQEIISELKNLEIKINSPVLNKEILNQEIRVILSKNHKIISNLIQDFNKTNWENYSDLDFKLKKATEELGFRFNIYLTKYNGLIEYINKNNVNADYKIFTPIVDGLKSLIYKINEIKNQKIEDTFLLNLFLVLFVFGVLLLILIRSKAYEYRAKLSVDNLSELEKSIKEIERELGLFQENKIKKINNNRNRKVLNLIDGINILIEKNKQNNLYLLNKIKDLQENLDKNEGVLKEVKDSQENVLIKNTNNLIEIDKLLKILELNEEIIDLLFNNGVSISGKNFEINSSLLDTEINVRELKSDLDKIMEQVGVLLSSANKLKGISNSLIELSEKTKVLSFNANILSSKGNNDGGFVQISNKIDSISESYYKNSKDSGSLTDNIFKNFEMIKINLGKTNSILEKMETKITSINNKNLNLKEIENQLENKRKMLNDKLKEIKIEELKENVKSLSEGAATIIDKNINNFIFNSNYNNGILKEIKEKIEDEMGVENE